MDGPGLLVRVVGPFDPDKQLHGGDRGDGGGVCAQDHVDIELAALDRDEGTGVKFEVVFSTDPFPRLGSEPAESALTRSEVVPVGRAVPEEAVVVPFTVIAPGGVGILPALPGQDGLAGGSDTCGGRGSSRHGSSRHGSSRHGSSRHGVLRPWSDRRHQCGRTGMLVAGSG
jgi:hypothetical protein